MSLIGHDLIATAVLPESDAEVWVRVRTELHLESQSALGLAIDDACGTALWVAEAVQDDLIEGHGSMPRTIVWPRCPDHRNHPLWLRSSDPQRLDPAWTCPTTERVVAQLGDL